MRKRTFVRATLLGALAAFGLPALASAQQIDWYAEHRSRFETRDTEGGASPTFTGMRTRFGFHRALGTNARVNLEIQDFRIWGSELSTTDGRADLLDLRIAVVELGHRGRSPLWLSVGRQMYEIAEGRIIGDPDWGNTGRQFDGVRGSIRLGERALFDVFGFQLSEAEAPTAVGRGDATLTGAALDLDVSQARDFQLYWVRDTDGVEDSTDRNTFGFYYLADAGPVEYRIESALQRGDLVGEELEAHMIAVRATVPFAGDRGTATLWYDRYSGDAETAGSVPTGAFSDLFSRNHRFFGFADLFSEIPADTDGRGLQDLALRGTWRISQTARVGLDLHRFLLTADEGLDDGHLADEVDLTLNVDAFPGIGLQAGASYVARGDAFDEIGGLAGNQIFGYLQLTAVF